MAVDLYGVIVLVLIVGGLVAGLVGVCVFVTFLIRARRSASSWGPEPAGPPVKVKAIGPSDKPVAGSARWDGDELVVQADQWTTKCLFDVPLDQVDQCLVQYRFRVKTEQVSGSVYPEMWCRIPERGQFFSRGLNRKVRHAADWKDVEIPFFLDSGQHADLLHLNLIFTGPAKVRLRDIEVEVVPVKGTR